MEIFKHLFIHSFNKQIYAEGPRGAHIFAREPAISQKCEKLENYKCDRSCRCWRLNSDQKISVIIKLQPGGRTQYAK